MNIQILVIRKSDFKLSMSPSARRKSVLNVVLYHCVILSLIIRNLPHMVHCPIKGYLGRTFPGVANVWDHSRVTSQTLRPPSKQRKHVEVAAKDASK